jgi:hypothetical protein
MLSPRHISQNHEGTSVMKHILSALGAAALMAWATPALADDTQSVDIVGTAEAFCSLPTSWKYVSSTSGVNASEFAGTTWTIPASLLADAEGNGTVTADEVAIRVRGTAACNTTHSIMVQSLNGGLTNTDTLSSPPPGFENNRRMIYNANWTNKEGWGVFNWIPQSAGDSATYDHANRAPPGTHEFDVRMGLLRDPTAGPMVAGTYTDQLVITISVPG